MMRVNTPERGPPRHVPIRYIAGQSQAWNLWHGLQSRTMYIAGRILR